MRRKNTLNHVYTGSTVPAQAHDSVLWMRMGHIRLTYTKRFFDQLIAWLFEFTQMRVRYVPLLAYHVCPYSLRACACAWTHASSPRVWARCTGARAHDCMPHLAIPPTLGDPDLVL